MARTVDEKRHQQRRLQIIDAALTRFAADGFDGTTTAAICRTAGIGSGTFFHYFPTKSDVLLAVLELGSRETSEFFDAHADIENAAEVLMHYIDHEADNLCDPRAAGFIRAVGAALHHDQIAVAVAAHQQQILDNLTIWVRRARRQGAIRTDLSAQRTARWLMALIDGFASQLAEGPNFDVRRERRILRDTIRRFLR
ncbi:TetR/AcrR family transcriptional regulator [Nocardia terpenica]|uniref:TetR family transcriptional regulator n=1 Tax=Nocardia terpenica TaxID=455432 RepID=A0A6G9Z6E8_9NOCA|nr:TetR/AcrR family transcriptional regulator [Nocardia terpenica]QIS20971.1 TetR family transcriptional regulator [Nocardia terpenica]